MRTTVTLEPDVQAAADALRQSSQISLSQAVNVLIRNGLNRENDAGPSPFRQRSQAVGLHIDVSNVAEALDLLDGIEHP